MLENAAPDSAFSAFRLAKHLARGTSDWGSNPLERLELWLAVTTLILIWIAAFVRNVGGLQWLGIRWTKPAREELWPILRAGEPPVPWWVLRVLSFLAAFPCLFPQYLGLIWSTRTPTTAAANMLHLCLLTGAVILASSVGRIGWLAAFTRTQRYQAVLLGALTVCACSMASSPLLIGLAGEARQLSWVAVACALLAVVTASAARPVEDVVADANMEWIEFGTPRTTSQRQQRLRDIPRLYRAFGAITQTLLIAISLDFTARFAGDLSFLCVVGVAALATAIFYEQYVPQTTIEACASNSAHPTPQPTPHGTPRSAGREPRRTPRRGKYAIALAHGVHSGLIPLAGPLFIIYAFQVLGIPIWLLGIAHAVALGSEALVLSFEDSIDDWIREEGLWFFGSFLAAIRLFFYTLVSARNAVWLLPLIEATYGISIGLANLAGSRLLARHGCNTCVSRSSKGPAGTLGDGGLAQSIGCVVWGLIWYAIGFWHTYTLGSLVGSALAVISCVVGRCCEGKEGAESSEDDVSDSSPQLG